MSQLGKGKTRLDEPREQKGMKRDSERSQGSTAETNIRNRKTRYENANFTLQCNRRRLLRILLARSIGAALTQTISKISMAAHPIPELVE